MSHPLIAKISEPFETPIGPGDDASNGRTTKTICRITVVRGDEQFKSFTSEPHDAAIAQAFRENGYATVGPRVGNEQPVRVPGEKAIFFTTIGCIAFFVLLLGGCMAIMN